jgi:predicted lipid-binding transport protein (Tim44 family)
MELGEDTPLVFTMLTCSRFVLPFVCVSAIASAVFANLQLHSPQQQQQSLLDAGAGSGLTLNIPSPPGSIQTPQQQQQQQQQQQADLLAEQPSSSEPAAAQVGRFQVISSIAEQH